MTGRVEDGLTADERELVEFLETNMIGGQFEGAVIDDYVDKLLAIISRLASDSGVMERAGSIMMDAFVATVTIEKHSPHDRFAVRHVDKNIEAEGRTLAEAVAALKARGGEGGR